MPLQIKVRLYFLHSPRFSHTCLNLHCWHKRFFFTIHIVLKFSCESSEKYVYGTDVNDIGKARKDREAQNSVQWFSGGWKVKEQREHRAELGKWWAEGAHKEDWIRQCCPLYSRIWPPTRFVRTSFVEHTLILGPRCRSGKPRGTLQSCSPASLPKYWRPWAWWWYFSAGVLSQSAKWFLAD